jgi:hypothetical protein
MRSMYAKIDEILKQKLMPKLQANLDKLTALIKVKEEDKAKIEENDKEINRIIYQIQKVTSFLWFNQRLILTHKPYFKESLTSDIPKYCHKFVTELIKVYEDPQLA